MLVHGWPLSAQAWEPQMSVLRAAGYRVVAYDRRGFGRSDKPLLGYSYDSLADDLQRVIDQCGLQDVTLVGFSMGGGEVARYIARVGESRLHGVVFAAAVPPYLMRAADNPEGPLAPGKAPYRRRWKLPAAAVMPTTCSSPFDAAMLVLVANYQLPTAGLKDGMSDGSRDRNCLCVNAQYAAANTPRISTVAPLLLWSP